MTKSSTPNSQPTRENPGRLTPTITMSEEDWANFSLVAEDLTTAFRSVDPGHPAPSDPKVIQYALRVVAEQIRNERAEQNPEG